VTGQNLPPSTPRTLALGERIREAREARGITVLDLADRVNVKENLMQGFEAGRYTPAPFVLHTLSRILALDYRELMVLAGHLVHGPKKPLPCGRVV
jgi:ribosome-binding protein aMBF1 (putative translation factor)